MLTFSDLKTGTIVAYNDTQNVDVQFVVLDEFSNDYYNMVDAMNLETKNIERFTSHTRIDGKRWTIIKEA
jgi:hypothetical protein